jgi:hypothetical protein
VSEARTNGSAAGAVTLLALALLAFAPVPCVQAATPTAAAAAGSLRPGVRLTIRGLLTRKGADPGSWFAITDAHGVIWRCVEVTPAMAARLQALQNRRVIVTARYRRTLLFRDIRLERLRALPRGK